MIKKLLKYILAGKSDDRDSYINKRVSLPGELLMEIFQPLHRKMLSDCNKFMKTRNTSDINPINIINQIKPGIVEQGFKNCFINWSMGKKRKM